MTAAPGRREIETAANVLRAGGLVILPTETVYGLAAQAADPAAVARLYHAKGRPAFNPLIVHVRSAEQARDIADLDDRAERLIEAFWPGGLTLVAPVRDLSAVCDLARAGLETVAVRLPAHPVARDLIEAVGEPIVAPSANRSGRPSPTTLSDAVAETGESAAVALDGGPCTVGVESTVIAVLDGPSRLLRPGAVTREAIEGVIGPLAEAENDARRSPGRLARHYAPQTALRLDVEEPRPGEAFIAYGPSTPAAQFNLSRRGDLAEAAARLFSTLRAADALGASAIAVAPIPVVGLGEAINDRLKRAAGFVG